MHAGYLAIQPSRTAARQEDSDRRDRPRLALARGDRRLPATRLAGLAAAPPSSLAPDIRLTAECARRVERTPRVAISNSMERWSETMPPFDAESPAVPKWPIRLTLDVTWRWTPLPWARNSGAATRLTRQASNR